MKKLFIYSFLFLELSIIGFSQETNEAKVVFYRKKKFLASAADLIIGSANPDTVFIKLQNATYHTVLINDFREWEFLAAHYAITDRAKINVEPNKTYFIHCYFNSGSAAKFELVDEQKAVHEMKGLKKIRNAKKK